MNLPGLSRPSLFKKKYEEGVGGVFSPSQFYLAVLEAKTVFRNCYSFCQESNI
jgi:hypothetical protein